MTDGEFQAIFAEHKNAVYQFAWRMSNSASVADDISQDVFLTLLRGEAEFDHARGSLRALLLSIARHLIWKRWRREQKWTSLEDEGFLSPAVDFESLSKQQAVAAAVAALPPLQREALILATYEELSLREIAGALMVEVGTVKARLHRARENLKTMLADYNTTTMRAGKRYGAAE
jgi:RNA polymerase sigma-70 factor (ECF subfamily)